MQYCLYIPCVTKYVKTRKKREKGFKEDGSKKKEAKSRE
jgi:hypothetical protein